MERTTRVVSGPLALRMEMSRWQIAISACRLREGHYCLWCLLKNRLLSAATGESRLEQLSPYPQEISLDNQQIADTHGVEASLAIVDFLDNRNHRKRGDELLLARVLQTIYRRRHA